MFRQRVLALVVVLVGFEGAARADDLLAQARKSVDESDYAAAGKQLAAARDEGGHSPEETAELYRLQGIVSAALGDTKAATDAFTKLLEISPKSSLPAGTSPKIMRPFDAAAKYVAQHGALELKLETESDPPALTLVTVNDPLTMVSKAHIAFVADGAAEQTKDLPASERTEIGLPMAARIDARVAALDSNGNHLVELGSKDVPVVVIGPARATPAPAPVPLKHTTQVTVHAGERPIYFHWWPYAAGTVVFAAAASYFAYRTHSDADDLRDIEAHSPMHTFSDAKSAEDRGHRDALITNIGFGVAGALAVTTGVMYLLMPRDHVETRVTAVPLTGGAAIVWGGHL